MKGLFIGIILFLQANFFFGQETEPDASPAVEQEIENHTEEEGGEPEDDLYLQNLEYYRTHPLNINEADPGELKEFRMLTALQIQNFILYRNVLGSFISIYELQSIPSWDISTIRRLLPYIRVADAKTISQALSKRLFVGDQSMLLRFSQVMQKAKGYLRDDASANDYLGSRPRLLFRYKYNFNNLLQYGLLGDKDAGEQFFKGVQRSGFDFYSFHLFARKLGHIKSLAMGDFSVNLGQGLIHWQGLAFKKSASIVSAKRQSDVLRPYSSAGEYNFFRGAGITFANKKWEATVFASRRKLSANIKSDASHIPERYISSVLYSGNHRTAAEVQDRNNLQAISAGSNIGYISANGHIGINAIQTFFSIPLGIADKPYDLFSIRGNRWGNYSVDYSYTFRNVHMYGEVASDKQFNTAFINGIIASIDRSVDIGVVHRRISKEYQSVYGNAFTESTAPSNETGLYTGITWRPSNRLKMDAYADVFRFPWLKFTTDAPGYGHEYLLQFTYTPSKRVEVIARYKTEAKHKNVDVGLSTNAILSVPRQSLRTIVSFKISSQMLLRNRLEVLWYDKRSERRESGYLVYLDLSYKTFLPVSGSARIQYFEADGYNARLYAYENDVLYSYSTPAAFNRGFRSYINLRIDVSDLFPPLQKHLTVQAWLRMALTKYSDIEKIGTGLEEIEGKIRSEIKFQLVFSR